MPYEVLLSIFSFLPVADMGRCAAVCEEWHEIVSNCTHLWKGKGKLFSSYRSPAQCAETRAVLNALPPLQEVSIEPGHGFFVSVSYPRVHFSMSNIGVIKNCPKLRCEVLSTRMAIAGDILTYGMTIDFKRLRHLRLNQTLTLSFWIPHDYSADYVVRTALDLCPNLRQLSVCTDTLSGEKLDEVEGLGRLRTLEISCSGLQKLLFLRHCSTVLEELQLLKCVSLPSCELRELRHLRNLRRLLLSEWNFEEADLVAAVVALGSIEWMELHRCKLVSDLSFLRHCNRLTEVRFTNSYHPDPSVITTLEDQQLRDLRLPVDADFRLVGVDGLMLTADDISAALTELQDLGLRNRCLAYLSNLRHCTQLRHICFEFVRDHYEQKQMNVRLFITLTGSP